MVSLARIESSGAKIDAITRHGTQLLFLTHMTHSFILLTANMEDVKKIARKFVSDSLAEKIAEFVAKATEQIVANVSEENDQNVVDIQNISDQDDQLQNIGRQRPERTTRDDRDETTRQVELQYEKANSTNDVIVEKFSNAGQVINWEKEVSQIAYDNSKEADEKQELDFDQPKINYEQSKLDYEQSKADNEQLYQENNQNLDNEPKLEFEQLNHDNGNQKLDYDQPKPTYQQEIDYEKPKTRKPKYHPHQNKLTNSESRKPDSNKYTHKPKQTLRPTIHYTILSKTALRNGQSNPKLGHRLTGLNSETAVNVPSTLQGFNIPKSLTTERIRDEFDQYDNPNYPKADFVATSGPVALPKVPMMKPWWEKEMIMPR